MSHGYGEALLDLEPHVVDAAEAQAMTRQQALRTLAASGDRMARLMLAGPVISDADVQRLRSFRSRATVIGFSVHMALLEMAR